MIVVEPGALTTFSHTSDNGTQLNFVIPAGAVTTPMELAFTEVATIDNVPSTLYVAGRAFAVVAYQAGEVVTPFYFATPITLTLTYQDEALAGTDETKLQLYYWDVASAQWLTDGITVVAHDLVNNRLVMTIAHLTTFAPFTSSSTAAATATPTVTPLPSLTPVPTATPPVDQNIWPFYLPLIQRSGFKGDSADHPDAYCHEDRCLPAGH